jgi:hypothetical protein
VSEVQDTHVSSYQHESNGQVEELIYIYNSSLSLFALFVLSVFFSPPPSLIVWFSDCMLFICIAF